MNKNTKLTDEEIRTYWDMLPVHARVLARDFYRGKSYPEIYRLTVEELLEDGPHLFDKTNAPRVYLSRHSAELRPGMGEDIQWEVGEVVEIIDGVDKGRKFKIKTESMMHNEAPGEFVREGKFLDGKDGRVAKREKQMWFVS